MTQIEAAYGSWKSPISSELIVSQSINFHHLTVDGTDVYWIEWRPAEGGRYCIVKRSAAGKIQDITPPGFNVRTLVHEYGGAAYTVADGTVYFSNYDDQNLYVQEPGKSPKQLTTEKGMRYTDGIVDRERRRFICVREEHGSEGKEAVNTIVSVPLEDKGDTQVLLTGNDFYSNPRLSPDGKSLAWLTWNHPNMPWDENELWVATVAEDGTLAACQKVAGGSDESIFQPEWSPAGELYFISDSSGWWNLYRRKVGEIEPVCQLAAEFGRPQWVFGYSTYCFESPNRIVCTYSSDGSWNIATIALDSKDFQTIETGYSDVMWLRSIPGQAYFRGGNPAEPASIIKLDLETSCCEAIRRSTSLAVEGGYISIPEPIAFQTGNKLIAHAFFYRPQNKDFSAPANEKPPLIVKVHGGPTGATSTTFNLELQYWTSRGFAVLDVNYGGSTGYGRPYRERINGQSGRIEIDDCVNGANHLVAVGEVDGARLLISGGSAGGYIVLCALTFTDVFACGASHYGIADPEALARDTHKFESRYLDRLIGPYPERRDIYLERSPLNHADRISAPIIFFQGLEDKVVPPNQAEMLVDALRKKKITVAYVPFPGEQHGFRKAETVKRALDGELYFYSQVLHFELADQIAPVEIENLKLQQGATSSS
jgi:dipeptidyl aminopeptidase/acylaminoacyl peptidase